MNRSPQCPDDGVLRRFLDEGFSGLVRDQINEHLADCAYCQSCLDALINDHDDRTEPAKSEPTREISLESSQFLSSFIRRLAEQPPRELLQIESESRRAESEDITFPGQPGPDAPLGQLGQYQILEKVAAGSNGLLYRARDTRLNRIVAIKVLRGELAANPTARARLLREAQIIASLRHDHIVRIYEVGDQPDFLPWLAMELIKGESLRERVKREGLMPPSEAVRIIRQIASALQHAAEQNLIHRDVKPSNIMIDELTDRAILTDFGLALDDDAEHLTASGALAGTPAYMSPEQIIDAHKVDERSDVYSLGVVLYHLLTGEPPFRGTVRMILLSVLHEDPRPLRRLNDTIPRELETICLKCLSKERSRRYQSAQELFAELTLWADGKPITAQPVSRLTRWRKWFQRNPKTGGLLTAVFLLLTTIAAVSTFASWRLNAATRRAEFQTQLAKNQRDVALETLQRLVFEVNEQLEQSESDVDEAQISLLRIVLQGLKQLGDSDAGTSDADVSTAAARSRIGVVLMRLGEIDQARRQMDSADAILSRLHAADPNDEAVNRGRLEALQNRSRIEVNFGDEQRARELLSDALKIGHDMLRGEDSADNRFSLAKVWVQVGQQAPADSPDESGLQGDGCVAYRKALKMLKSLTAESARADYRDALLGCLDDYGYHLSESGFPREALAAYAELLAGLREDIDRNPNDYYLLVQAISVCRSRADLFAGLNSTAEQRREIEAALNFARKLELLVIDGGMEVEELEAELKSLDNPKQQPDDAD